jgi:hypothetical protein
MNIEPNYNKITAKGFFKGLACFLGSVMGLFLFYKLPMTQQFILSENVQSLPITQVPLEASAIDAVQPPMPATAQSVFTASSGAPASEPSVSVPTPTPVVSMPPKHTNAHKNQNQIIIPTPTQTITPIKTIIPTHLSIVAVPVTSIIHTSTIVISPSAPSASVSSSAGSSTIPIISPVTVIPPVVTTPQTPAVTSPVVTPTPPVVTPTPPIVLTSTSTTGVGISFGDTLPAKSIAQLDAIFADLNSIGITWIRFDMAWSDIQHDSQSTYDWSAMDRIVAAANTYHLKMLPDLAYTPAWARDPACSTNDKCEPANNTDFATFVQTAAKRYTSQGIVDWEIWNEPNINNFWLPAPDPQKYTNLLQASYTAIKNQNSTAVVISAGLAPSLTQTGRIAPIEFLQDMYKDGAQPYFDAVGDHPYSFPVPPSLYETWSGWSQMSQTPTSIRSVMAANGDSGKQVWMTEYGAPTGGPGQAAWIGDTDLSSDIDHVSDNLQAESITEAITSDQQSSWAGPIFIYSYEDLGTSTSTNENFFGILWNDGTDKPAYTAIKNLLE